MSVYINGISMLTPVGAELQELWEHLHQEDVQSPVQAVKIPPFKYGKVLRRMDRFSTMALYGAFKAVEDAAIEGYDPFDVGTVFNSIYGPLSTTLNFGEFVINGQPELASPTMFSGTVNNACLGHVCIHLGVKGPSTMLLCSNYIGYSAELIKRGKAKAVVAGGLDEYYQALFDEFIQLGYPVGEHAVTLVMANESNEHTYCEWICSLEGNLGGHPYITPLFQGERSRIESIMRGVIQKAELNFDDIDGVITATGHLDIYSAEVDAIRGLFNNQVRIINPKKRVRDALGANEGMNVGIGATILKQQKIPELLLDQGEDLGAASIRVLLVNHYDVSGGFTSCVIKAVS